MNNKRTSSANDSRARFSYDKEYLLEIITLQSPRGRLTVAALVHLALFFVPYRWLTNLSLYKLLGLDWVPSIGLTRAYWLLFHGDLVAAWQRNWFIFPVLTVMWSIVALDTYSVFKQSDKNA